MSTTLPKDEWSDEIDVPKQRITDQVSLQPAIQRWWWWFLLAAIISAPIAYFAADYFASDSYVYDTRLIFNRSHFGAPLYEPPDIYAIAALTTSPSMLHDLKYQLKLQPDVERLESLLEPEVRGGSTVMAIALEWESAEKSEEILNWINEKLVDRVQSLRDDRIDHSLADLREQFDKYRTKSETLHERIVAFRQKYKTFGVLDHLRTIETEQKALEKAIAIAESEKESLQIQIEAFTDRVAEIEEAAATEELTEADLDAVDLDLEREKEFAREQAKKDAEQKYAAVLDQIKQNRLQKSIREERERTLLTTKLEVKRRALTDARRLFERRLIPQAEVQTIEDEVRLLELELVGTEKLKEWEQELETVSGRMDENMLEAAKNGEFRFIGNFSSNGSTEMPRNNDMNATLGDLQDKWQLQFETKKKLISKMHDATEKIKVEKDELNTVLPQAERMQREFDRAEMMRSKLEAQITDLEMLKRSDSNLLAILEPPSPGLMPVKSNKKKLMVAIYALAGCLLCAPIVLKELFAPAAQHRSPRTAVRPR